MQNRATTITMPHLFGLSSRNHDASGASALEKGDRVIWARPDVIGNNVFGKELRIDMVTEGSASQGNPITYSGTFVNNDGKDASSSHANFPREHLYASGDQHIDSQVLKEALLANIKWKISERCLLDERGVMIDYVPKIKSQKNFAEKKIADFAKLRGQRVYIPDDVPYIDLNTSKFRPSVPYKTVIVEDVLVGGSNQDFGCDPMAVWTDGDSKIAVPADMVFIQGKEEVSREPITSPIATVDDLIF